MQPWTGVGFGLGLRAELAAAEVVVFGRSMWSPSEVCLLTEAGSLGDGRMRGSLGWDAPALVHRFGIDRRGGMLLSGSNLLCIEYE